MKEIAICLLLALGPLTFVAIYVYGMRQILKAIDDITDSISRLWERDR